MCDANRFASQPLDAGTKRQIVTFNALCKDFTCQVLLLRHFSGIGQHTANFGIVSVPEPVLYRFIPHEAPLLIKFADKSHIGVSDLRRGYPPGGEFFKARMTVLMPIFSFLAVLRIPEPL